MPEPARIIIVEDDVALAKGLQRILISDGFDVSLAFSGAELIDLLNRGGVDLVLLDLNLGAEDGMDIARELARTRSTGLIIITGRGGKADLVAGLEAGADDYLAKPFDPDELRARMRAVLRRRQHGRDALPVLAVGPFRLNTANRCLSREGDDARIEFTARETSLLAYLIAHLGEPVHRADLARGEYWTPDDRATDVHMSHIRHKLQGGGMSELCIQPVRGVGYQLTCVLPGESEPKY